MIQAWVHTMPAVTFRGDSWGSVIGQMLLYLAVIGAVAYAANRYRKSRDKGR